MKSIKLLGLSLLAIFALGVFAAASASAEEGFLPSPGTGNILGKTSILEPEGGGKIQCATLDESTLTFLSLEPDGHAEGTLHWLGCKAEGLFAFNSKGDKSEEVLIKVLLLVCLDPKNASKELVSEYGVLVLVEGTQDLEVPAVGALVEVQGQALGALLTLKGKLFVADLTGEKGKQKVAVECLVNGKTVKHNLLSSKNKAAFEPASENVVGGLVQFAKEVELMNK